MRKYKKRTLLYLASGAYSSEYEKLPYEKVILIDKSIPQSFAQAVNTTSQKVEIINSDALEGIKQLKDRNITIDCLVSLNEGLQEGGGEYPIFSEFLLGYLSPILAKEILVILDLDYYKPIHIKSKVKRMNWGYQLMEKLEPKDQDYIPPAIFSESKRKTQSTDKYNFGQVFLLKKESKLTHGTIGKTKVVVKQTSIFENYQLLDAAGICYPKPCDNAYRKYYGTVSNFLYSHDKVFSIRNKSFQEILKYCQNHKIEKLGIVPWLNHEYRKVIELLEKYNSGFPSSIHFYHLHREDFKVLYDYLGLTKKFYKP